MKCFALHLVEMNEVLLKKGTRASKSTFKPLPSFPRLSTTIQRRVFVGTHMPVSTFKNQICFPVLPQELAFWSGIDFI